MQYLAGRTLKVDDIELDSIISFHPSSHCLRDLGRSTSARVPPLESCIARHCPPRQMLVQRPILPPWMA